MVYLFVKLKKKLLNILIMFFEYILGHTYRFSQPTYHGFQKESDCTLVEFIMHSTKHPLVWNSFQLQTQPPSLLPTPQPVQLSLQVGNEVLALPLSNEGHLLHALFGIIP